MLREYRIYGIAIFDLVITYLVAFLIDIRLNVNDKLTYYFMLLPLGVIIHVLFNQKTFLNNKLLTTKFNNYHIFSGIYILIYISILLLRTR